MPGKLSIILPTLNEGENLKVLIPRIHKIIKKGYEIIIVDDDSKDNTEKIIKNLKRKKFPIKFIQRKREKGLSSAVIRGIKESKGKVILVMDADLSHPPEIIPEMIKYINKGYDMVVASRFLKDSYVEQWKFYRKLVSLIGVLVAKPLVNVTDPLAGFFAFKRKIISDIDILNPIGFKILLEILVKYNVKNIKEIPYTFYPRFKGESKADVHIYLQYYLHILKLYFFKLKNFIKRLTGKWEKKEY